jgi:hypothetical protein
MISPHAVRRSMSPSSKNLANLVRNLIGPRSDTPSRNLYSGLKSSPCRVEANVDLVDNFRAERQGRMLDKRASPTRLKLADFITTEPSGARFLGH